MCQFLGGEALIGISFMLLYVHWFLLFWYLSRLVRVNQENKPKGRGCFSKYDHVSLSMMMFSPGDIAYLWFQPWRNLTETILPFWQPNYTSALIGGPFWTLCCSLYVINWRMTCNIWLKDFTFCEFKFYFFFSLVNRASHQFSLILTSKFKMFDSCQHVSLSEDRQYLCQIIHDCA